MWQKMDQQRKESQAMDQTNKLPRLMQVPCLEDLSQLSHCCTLAAPPAAQLHIDGSDRREQEDEVPEHLLGERIVEGDRVVLLDERLGTVGKKAKVGLLTRSPLSLPCACGLAHAAWLGGATPVLEHGQCVLWLAGGPAPCR